MAKLRCRCRSWHGASARAFVLSGAHCVAQVRQGGVTSATDGDPFGNRRPRPSACCASARVQGQELIHHTNDRPPVFLDGSSLTVVQRPARSSLRLIHTKTGDWHQPAAAVSGWSAEDQQTHRSSHHPSSRSVFAGHHHSHVKANQTTWTFRSAAELAPPVCAE